MEQYTNNPGTTLNSSINNSVTSLVVTSASSFPTSGTFSILIGTEIMTVTAVSGTTFTVTRGAESTTAASHTSGDAVDGTLTKRAMDQIAADQNMYDTYANLPTATKKGRIYTPSDGGMQFYDDGSAWHGFGGGTPLYDPNLYSWSWVNQGPATVGNNGVDIKMHTNGGTGAPGFALRVKTAPTPPYTIMAKFTHLFHATSASTFFSGACVAFRNSSSGKLHVLMTAWHSAIVQYWSTKYTDATTFSADYVNIGVGRIFEPIPRWLWLKDDNTSRYVGISYDGVQLETVDSQTRTDFFTPDQVCWGFRDDTTESLGVILHSWQEF